MEKYLTEAVTETIKKELCNLQVECSRKQVVGKTGYEEVYTTIFLKQQEFVYAEHHFETPVPKAPEQIANEIFISPLKIALLNALEYNSLKVSWWKRVKFVFTK